MCKSIPHSISSQEATDDYITAQILHIIPVVGEANEGQVVSCKSFRNGKRLGRTLILLYFVKVTRVNITGQVWYYWWIGWLTDKQLVFIL